jgi:hypothetical protein
MVPQALIEAYGIIQCRVIELKWRLDGDSSASLEPLYLPLSRQHSIEFIVLR